MAKRETTVRRVSIDTISKSLARTLSAEGKSEKTIYSYTLSVRLLTEFLAARGHDLTVDVSKDDVREFIAEQGTRRKIIDSKGRVHQGAARPRPSSGTRASSSSSGTASRRTSWRCRP